MSKSATALGQLFGVTSQVMNVILKELGYLEGAPGAYGVTEKGAKYAFEKDYHRGPGGYSWYNRDWTTRTWDAAIVDELHVTDDLKRKAQEAVSAARAAKRVAKAVANHVGVDADTVVDNAANVTSSGKKAGVAAAGLAVLAGSAYGIYKAAPHAKKLLGEKVVPGLKNIKDKVLQKSDKEPCGEPGAVDGLSGGVGAD
ncbi:hypothetical protein AB0C42_01695 [Micromonospora taraxaci]|uniref:hypothetical protein n=1 Tax=Micromonospora taraxaci TaxID=1316803 RepID=UPI003406AB8E